MEKSYWQSRWVKDKTGFHTPEMDPSFLEYWPRYFTHKHANVLVPLCGKATEMKWLSDNHYNVTGIEFIQKACTDYFQTFDITPKITHKKGVDIYEHENIRVLNADFFKPNTDLKKFADYVYDRAALIALPEQMRGKYVQIIKRYLKETSQILLITLEYDQEEMKGPPFSVPIEEVKSLYGIDFKVDLIERRDILDSMVRFRERGLTSLVKNIMLLRPHHG